MLLDLVRRARQFAEMTSAGQFRRAFSLELARLRGFTTDRAEGEFVDEMFGLHRRFGIEVLGVIERGLQTYKKQLSRGEMAPGSLLTFVVGDQVGPRMEGDSTIEAPAAIAPRSTGPIELTIDAKRGQFSINGRAPIRAKRSTAFLLLLAAYHREDLQAEQSAASFRYVPRPAIEDRLIITAGALGRLVKGLRDRIGKELQALGRASDDRGIVIQSMPWKGYRLNPHIRLVAAAD
jgi:hypothetical protein